MYFYISISFSWVFMNFKIILLLSFIYPVKFFSLQFTPTNFSLGKRGLLFSVFPGVN